ncbi:MAG TPA: 50S ribosomal protein L10 [Thermoleophilaceae bacterium]|nr:50S ribosomal protein L10 [Thermoleophilaceae bacterium]
MNRDQKSAVIDEVAAQITDSAAVFAIDYRGLSVPQAAELRERLGEADASLRVVKNTLTLLAADKAGAESLKELLEGPTAFTFVRGDAALAAKAIATFRREHELLAFKGGTMDGDPVSIDEIEAISKLPARNVLDAQLVGVLASPVTGLVRGLNQLIAGLAMQLGQIAEQGLVEGEAPAAAEDESTVDTPPPEGSGSRQSTEEPAAEAAAPAAEEPAAEAEAAAPAEEEASAEEPAAEAEAAAEAPAETEDAPAEEAPAEQASGDEPAAEEAPAEQASGDAPTEQESDAPSEGDVE